MRFDQPLAAASLLAGVLIAAPAAAVTEGPAPAAPAARDFRLGALKLTSLRTGLWIAPNDGTVFGDDPAAAARLLAANGAPTDAVTLGADVLLVRLPGHVVLLDAGLSPKDGGVLVASLALAGVRPADVTDVLITHRHLDHTGGLLDAAGGRAFPRAVVRMSAREWTAMQADAETAPLAAVIARQVRPFEPGRDILPGITPVALYGHTPGHVGYEVRSRGRRLEDIGDLAHSAILNLARPAWADKYDVDPAAGSARRRDELGRLAAGGELVFAPHFPFPGLGKVVRQADGYRWAPVASGTQR